MAFIDLYNRKPENAFYLFLFMQKKRSEELNEVWGIASIYSRYGYQIFSDSPHGRKLIFEAGNNKEDSQVWRGLCGSKTLKLSEILFICNKTARNIAVEYKTCATPPKKDPSLYAPDTKRELQKEITCDWQNVNVIF